MVTPGKKGSLHYYGIPPETPNELPKIEIKLPEPGLVVLILCAGKLRPWEKNNPKQLRPMGDETILGRMIRQIRENGYEPVVITWRDDIKAATPDLQHYEPQRCRTIAETWLYTRELWKEQTCVILGDVIHGDETMKQLLAYRGPMKMVGNSAEIFDFTFDWLDHRRLARILLELDNHTWKGSPWEVYWRWCRITDKSKEDKVFQWVWDRTCDVDTEYEYKGALGVFGKGKA